METKNELAGMVDHKVEWVYFSSWKVLCGKSAWKKEESFSCDNLHGWFGTSLATTGGTYKSYHRLEEVKESFDGRDCNH